MRSQSPLPHVQLHTHDEGALSGVRLQELGGGYSWLKWPLLVGFLLRLLWALVVPVIPVSDSFIYQTFAESLAAGNGYAFADGKLTAYWPVGTSAVYATLFFLFGQGYLPIVVLNLILGVALIWLSGQLAARLFDNRVAVLTAWIVALWPLLIQYTSILASELLFTALLMGSLWAWSQSHWRTVPRTLSWSVLMIGALYVRPTVLPLFVLLPVLDAWQQRRWRATAEGWLLSAVVGVLLVGPWAARNAQVFGKPVLVSTNFGVNFWMGNNPSTSGGYMDPLPTAPRHEFEADRYYRQLAWQYIAEEPGQFFVNMAKRARTTFDRESIGVVWNEQGLKQRGLSTLVMPLKAMSAAYWWLVLLAALLGLFLAIAARRIDLRQPIWWTAALLVAVPLMTVGQDRYHVPLNPVIAMLAAFAAARWLHRREGKT
jgi:4-amino-4-deoxy-L-arabinose transferase-like glycosyltransferase